MVARPRGPNHPMYATVGQRIPVPMSARATGPMRGDGERQCCHRPDLPRAVHERRTDHDRTHQQEADLGERSAEVVGERFVASQSSAHPLPVGETADEQVVRPASAELIGNGEGDDGDCLPRAICFDEVLIHPALLARVNSHAATIVTVTPTGYGDPDRFDEGRHDGFAAEPFAGESDEEEDEGRYPVVSPISTSRPVRTRREHVDWRSRPGPGPGRWGRSSPRTHGRFPAAEAVEEEHSDQPTRGDRQGRPIAPSRRAGRLTSLRHDEGCSAAASV